MLAILKHLFKKFQLFSVLFLMKEDNQRHYPYCVNTHCIYMQFCGIVKVPSTVTVMSSLTRHIVVVHI